MASKAQSNTDKLRQRNHELSIINTMAEALNRETDLTRALHVMLAHVADLLDLKTGWVWLLHEETGVFYVAASQNLPPALANSPRRLEGSCYCLDSYSAGDLEGAANVNVVACTRLKDLIAGTLGLRYHASIPLYAHGKELGVMNVASTDWKELSDDELRLLYTMGDLLSIAIERARLFARSAEFGALEERNRLAREIHDTLAQGMAAIALKLETADALLEANSDSTRTRHMIQDALDLTRANLEEVRRSVLDLRAAPLEGRTLADALPVLVKEWAGRQGIDAHCEVVGAQRPFPLRVEAGLFRIAQEAVTNVIRHAHARRLMVRLTATPEQVQLSVEDDGVGFDPQAVPKSRFGLIGLNERARLLGGKVELSSAPGKGTIIIASIPLGVA
ncbi:MAG TPA: GAF domain-containing sensor histidine kinase [Aggregatilineales bacterium]|nr:GAF domain-containing sensor histidine kinase [Aggregatilineales bacterium]